MRRASGSVDLAEEDPGARSGASEDEDADDEDDEEEEWQEQEAEEEDDDEDWDVVDSEADVTLGRAQGDIVTLGGSGNPACASSQRRYARAAEAPAIVRDACTYLSCCSSN